MNHHAAVENHEIFKLRLGRLFLAGIKGLFHSALLWNPGASVLEDEKDEYEQEEEDEEEDRGERSRSERRRRIVWMKSVWRDNEDSADKMDGCG